MDDLLQDFIAETRDMLADIADEIVAWEANPADRARLERIFRFVHTIKGNCGFLDQPRLSRLSHAAEDVLAALLAGTRTADAMVVGALLAVIGRIEILTEAIGPGRMPPEAEDHRLIAALALGTTPVAQDAAVVRRGASHGQSATVRLPATLLDRITTQVTNVASAQEALSDCLREAGMAPATRAALDRLSASVAQMRQVACEAERRPIGTVFASLPRLIRSVALESGKRVSLRMDDGGIDLDRGTIAAIRAPLLHVLRNAVAHGIETPADRMGQGKPASGRLTLSADLRGGSVFIAVSDDGRGIDGNGLARKAVAAGMASADRVATLDDAGRIELVFLPGLSTADAATWLSGRGMGMDAVRTGLAGIGGRVKLESRPGEGTTVTFIVPAPTATGLDADEALAPPSIRAFS